MGKVILALDGGGVKGINQLLILRELEKQLGKPVHEVFDLIVGTSVGALTAGALGLLKKPASELIDPFKQLIFKTFRTNLFRLFKPIFGGGIFQTGFMESELQSSRYFEEKSLHDYEDQATKVAFVATNRTTDMITPYIFRNYHIPLPTEGDLPVYRYTINDGTSHVKVWEALRASTAAPALFDPMQIGERIFNDGGLVANNPVEIALQEAHFIWPKEEVDVVVSLGCGLFEIHAGSSNLLKFNQTLLDIVLDSEKTERRFSVNLNLFRCEPLYLRFNPPHAGDVSLSSSKQSDIAFTMNETNDYIASPIFLEMIAKLKSKLEEKEK